VAPSRPAFWRQRAAARLGEPTIESLAGKPSNGHDSLLGTFPIGAQQTFVDGHVGERETDELGDPEAGAVQDFEDGPVPPGDGVQPRPTPRDEPDVGREVPPIGGERVRRPSALDRQPGEVLLDRSGKLHSASAHRCIMARTVGVDRTVTVVIPTRDRLSLLREAVASVLAQDLVSWELIVVDDASSDRTAEWVEGLADERG